MVKKVEEVEYIVCPACSSNIVIDDVDKRIGSVDCPLCGYTIEFTDKRIIIKKEEFG